MSFANPGSPGVLPAQWLRMAIESKVITSPTYTLDSRQIQPASLDLRLGDYAHRLRCSFLPGRSTVEAALPRFAMDRIDLRDGAVLERNRPYLIQLCEELALPAGLLGRANPKSSTGRLDIFTRLITDGSLFFDEIRGGYCGRLYLELVSRSFTIRVKRGLSLNQLRLSTGRSRQVSDKELRAAHNTEPLLFADGAPIPVAKLPLKSGLFLSLALGSERGEPVGWRAKKNSYLLDLTSAAEHDPYEFWEPVFPERGGGGVILEPEEFYLLMSREHVRVPPGFAAEMAAYDPTSGELRTHYAGFFDPGFGHRLGGHQTGSRAALEVRAHDVAFMIQDGQRICRLSFEQLCDEPDFLYGSVGSHYQFQSRTLSRHFARPDPPDRRPRDRPPGAGGQRPAAGRAGTALSA